ncbi:MAG: hypothetical protein ACTSWW_10215 [Promethearchaeota archaeon]
MKKREFHSVITISEQWASLSEVVFTSFSSSVDLFIYELAISIIDIMATTVQIEKDVKQKLFQLKLAFSQKLGRSVNYNEVIEELITLHQEKIIKTDRYQNIRDLANKFDRKLYDEYRQEKLKDLNQEEQNYPISQTR